MADYPNTSLFDELEFLQFSDDQFDAEIDRFCGDDSQQTALFHDGGNNSGQDQNQPGNQETHSGTLTELRDVVASYTVGVYHSPESAKDINVAGDFEKTLNALVVDQNSNDCPDLLSSGPVCETEEMDVTMKASFSATMDMSSDQESTSLELLQISEVSQSDPQQEDITKKKKLRVAHKPSTVTCKSGYVNAPSSRSEVFKRKRAFSEDYVPAADSKHFKASKKVKRYEAEPFEDPAKERSRLNAINAKINRDRKKKQAEEVNQKCERLLSDNRELSSTNRSLEERLRAAEEEIAFLRQTVMNRVGHGRPLMDAALKSITDGNSAAAGG